MSAFISARDLVVEFPVYNASHRSLKKQLISATTGGRIAADVKRRLNVRALDGVNFELKPGDRLGLVGHNGAGKTTLLRALAGVYPPSAGTLTVKGRLACLTDIAVGIDGEATGFENIYLRGIVMGMTPREISAKLDDIAEFSELGDYLNMPVRTYSSGMQLRLAFAVSTSIDADIVLMDEWLSVGDAQFNAKASQRLSAMVEKSSILVIASHQESVINDLCNRRVRLEHGRLVELC
ncbi:Teichoic acids export ATP-binding protein TagH [Pigmentiphaga humi]|uniref:Teichoic acids export ATP-binding protein TagH n=1 Tax=Pigmentiphaga humi TaxID=2478468 RepID=A0A3P4AZJ3_9BURK|nr:ABC transporter ATP-binding protein [Pigmentiphaga humi]VCU69467.1 Teichoic acids export ATP-binding protein TagH [Pigmentiphaga humi]